ncbi:MAG: hypothetical protein ABIO44_13110, partial [Saprospiraceae bacterium]
KDKDAIVHKLANSLRRFELNHLEKYWREIDLESLDRNELKFEKSMLHFKACIEYIEAQKNIWNS